MIETKFILWRLFIMKKQLPKTHMGKQLEHAVRACNTFCHSKRSDKFNDAIDTEWKVYSDKYKDDLVDLALDFGRFITKTFPHVRNSFDIGPGEILAFLETKTSTCKDSTLKTKIIRLWKIEKCCMRISCTKNKEKFHWNTSDVVIPKSTKKNAYSKNKTISLEIAKVAIADLKGKETEAGNAVAVSAFAGTRVEESSCLKVENVHFSGGEFNLGWIHIIEGPEGGAKGGKERVIPIVNQETQDVFKSLVAGKTPGDYIAAKEGGGKLSTARINDALKKGLKARHGDTYLFNGCHAMRKTWAQLYYDITRKNYTRKEAISKTNLVLGHGKNRGEQGIDRYVVNRH